MADTIVLLLEEILGTSLISRYIITLLIAMIPVIELRGAIPIGVGVLGLPLIPVTIVSFVGNMLPVPFIVLFIRKIFGWMRKKSKRLGSLVDRFERRAKSKGSKFYRGKLIGLLLFVAIPLPGTGAWTGALIAAMLNIRLRNALLVIAGGVAIAGIIIAGITYGFSSL